MGDNRPPPSLAHTMSWPWWWSFNLSGVPLLWRRPAAAACLYNRSSSQTKCDSSSWAVRSAVPHTGQQPVAAADCCCCWPPAAEDCLTLLLLLLLELLLLWWWLMAVVGVAVAVPWPPPPPTVVADVVAAVVVVDVTGGDGFFPAEQPKISLKSKYGGRTGATGVRNDCFADCCGCRAVKSVIAQRTVRTATTNWFRWALQRQYAATKPIVLHPAGTTLVARNRRPFAYVRIIYYTVYSIYRVCATIALAAAAMQQWVIRMTYNRQCHTVIKMKLAGSWLFFTFHLTVSGGGVGQTMCDSSRIGLRIYKRSIYKHRIYKAYQHNRFIIIL